MWLRNWKDAWRVNSRRREVSTRYEAKISARSANLQIISRKRLGLSMIASFDLTSNKNAARVSLPKAASYEKKIKKENQRDEYYPEAPLMSIPNFTRDQKKNHRAVRASFQIVQNRRRL